MVFYVVSFCSRLTEGVLDFMPYYFQQHKPLAMSSVSYAVMLLPPFCQMYLKPAVHRTLFDLTFRSSLVAQCLCGPLVSTVVLP